MQDEPQWVGLLVDLLVDLPPQELRSLLRSAGVHDEEIVSERFVNRPRAEVKARLREVVSSLPQDVRHGIVAEGAISERDRRKDPRSPYHGEWRKLAELAFPSNSFGARRGAERQPSAVRSSALAAADVWPIGPPTTVTDRPQFVWASVRSTFDLLLAGLEDEVGYRSELTDAAPQISDVLLLGQQVLALAERTSFDASVDQVRLANDLLSVMPRQLDQMVTEAPRKLLNFLIRLAPVADGLVEALSVREQMEPGNDRARDDLGRALRLAAQIGKQQSQLVLTMQEHRPEGNGIARAEREGSAPSFSAGAGLSEVEPNPVLLDGGTDPSGGRRTVFIVHGHDDALKEAVARVLERAAEVDVVILHEQLDGGSTIMEKFERHAQRASFAVVLLTPDDVIAGPEGVTEDRARQNVILELGYFVGRLGRERVCALRKGDVTLPSDYLGVLYKPVDTAGAWKYNLGKELRGAGISVDLNRL